jgi:hypothetical protein
MGFAGLLWAQRLFSRSDADQSGSLNLDEFLAMMDHPRFNQPLLVLIDEIVMPT